MTLIQSTELHNADRYPEYVGYNLYYSGHDYVVRFMFNRKCDCAVRGTYGTGVKYFDTRQAAINAGLRYMSKF